MRKRAISCNLPLRDPYLQDRFAEVKSILQPFLKLSGFRESHIRWLPAVGPSGENLVGPPTEPALADWWHGSTLVQIIDGFKPSARDVHKPLRLPVTDVFKSARGGAALGGRLAGGALKVHLLPLRAVQCVSLEAPSARHQE